MDFTKPLTETELRGVINSKVLTREQWEHISHNQVLSEKFIRDFKDKVHWTYIYQNQTLSEGFIKEFKEELNWYGISIYQVLSEEFIREFKNEVNWSAISRYQTLSEDFIREFKNEVNWEEISQNQVLSDEFIEEFKYLLDPKEYLCLNVVHNCGLQKRTIRVQKKDPSIIHIRCFEGTKKEAIEAVQKKYGLNSEYEKQIHECFNF